VRFRRQLNFKPTVSGSQGTRSTGMVRRASLLGGEQAKNHDDER
jgi:hypothetical protein